MRTNGIVSHDVVRLALPKTHEEADTRAERRHFKAAVDLRVRLLEAAGGEQNLRDLSQAELAAMQHVVRWHIGDHTEHGANAIAYLDTLKAEAAPGTPQVTVTQRIQTTVMNLKALLSRARPGKEARLEQQQSTSKLSTEAEMA